MASSSASSSTTEPAKTEPAMSMMEFFERINANTPLETRKAFTEIERLDKEVKRLSEGYHQRKIQYMLNYATMTPEVRVQTFLDIQDEMNVISGMAEKKVEIANGVRDTVEKIHKEFQEYEGKFVENMRVEMQDEARDGEEPEEDDEEPEEQRVDRRKKKKSRNSKKEDKGKAATKEKETFCWCQLEKEDKMICCDSKQCKYQWFHFTCISLTKTPPGKWYCSDACETVAKYAPPEPEEEEKNGEEDDEEEAAAPAAKGRKANKKRKT